MKLSLIVTKGRRRDRVIPITIPQFIIGRHKECHLKAGSPSISQHHCALLTRGPEVMVRDFDSTNGTFINRKQVEGEQKVGHEDLLEVGPLAFRIHIEAEPADTAPGFEADESALVKMLLGESNPVILGLNEDSQCGSTVSNQPAPGAVRDEPRKSPSSPKRAASPPDGENQELAKKVLDKFDRALRKKHNPAD